MVEEVIGFDSDLERRIKEEFGDEATPEFLNMLRLAKAVYEHAYHNFVPKEKIMEWVERMYNAGQHQYNVRQGILHGRIFINSGDVMNVASYLSCAGVKDGFISQKKS